MIEQVLDAVSMNGALLIDQPFWGRPRLRRPIEDKLRALGRYCLCGD